MITHTLHTIPSDINKIVVTKHCYERFKQRLHLYLTITEKSEPRLINKAIRSMIVKSGSIDRKYEFSPFYRNKQTTNHGQHIIIHLNFCTFRARFDGDKLILITATGTRIT